MGIQYVNRNIFAWDLTGENKIYFFGLKDKNAMWDATLLLHITSGQHK